MWLHILVGPCWCVYVALFGSKKKTSKKYVEYCLYVISYKYGDDAKLRII